MLYFTLTDPAVFEVDGFFYNDVIMLGTEHTMVWSNLLCSFLTFFLCWITELKGAQVVSYIVYFTCPVPIIFLLILAIRGLFLEGAGDGI